MLCVAKISPAGSLLLFLGGLSIREGGKVICVRGLFGSAVCATQFSLLDNCFMF